MRVDGQSVRFMCVAVERCPTPTAIEIKGVLRTENLPAAFVRGPLSPEELTRQGEINAKAKGSRFLGAVAVKVAGIEGVQMTAAVGAEGKAIHFLTTWLGRGDRMLDVKITSPDLALARKLAADGVGAAGPAGVQVGRKSIDGARRGRQLPACLTSPAAPRAS